MTSTRRSYSSNESSPVGCNAMMVVWGTKGERQQRATLDDHNATRVLGDQVSERNQFAHHFIQAVKMIMNSNIGDTKNMG